MDYETNNEDSHDTNKVVVGLAIIGAVVVAKKVAALPFRVRISVRRRPTRTRKPVEK